MEVLQHQGRRVRRVFPRQPGRRQHGEDTARRARRRGGLLLRHALYRLHGRGEGQHPDRRNGGRDRAGTREDVVTRVRELTGGEGADTTVEALGADPTFQTAIKITKPGGTISNIGYFGEGEFVSIPRVDWGVGMADQTIASGLCAGGRMRMQRLLRVLEGKRVDPTLMTTHTFEFADMERAFEVSDKKLDDV